MLCREGGARSLLLTGPNMGGWFPLLYPKTREEQLVAKVCFLSPMSVLSSQCESQCYSLPKQDAAHLTELVPAVSNRIVP